MVPIGTYLHDKLFYMDGNFGSWLLDEIEERKWSQADLAEKAGVTNATISRLVNGTRNPGPDLAKKLADALNYPPEFVFRIADLLPPKSESNPTLEEANRLLSELPEEYQKQALQLVRFLHSTHVPHQKNKKAKSTSN